jgi:hypothetical protein
MNGKSKRENVIEFFREHQRPQCIHALTKSLGLNVKTSSALVSVLAKSGEIRSVRTGVCKYQGVYSHQHYVAKFKHFPKRQHNSVSTARIVESNGSDIRAFSAQVERKNRVIVALAEELYGK